MCSIVRFKGRFAFMSNDFRLPDGTTITERFEKHKPVNPDKQIKLMEELVHWKYYTFPVLRVQLVMSWPDKLVNGTSRISTAQESLWAAEPLPAFPYWKGQNMLGIISMKEREKWR